MRSRTREGGQDKSSGTTRDSHYVDRHFNLPAAKIGPGEVYATQRNMIIVTVLGSCVSACIRDPETNVGGMNHFMLPHHEGEPDGPLSESARYGAYAMEVLVNHLLSLGARRERLEAKIFGAGRIVGRPVFDVGRHRAGQFQRLVVRLRRQRDDEVEIQPFPVVEFLERGRLVA